MSHPASAAQVIVALTLALAGCTTQAAAGPPQPEPTVAAATTQAPAPLPPSSVSSTTVGVVTGWPQPLTIPKLNMTAPIVGVCTTNPDGSIEPPTDIHAVCASGRPDLDPTGVGYTSLTGHTTRAASTGALEPIWRLVTGDTFTTGTATWRVVQTGWWPATALPPQYFQPDGPRLLILTTCHLTPAVRAGAPYTDTDLAIAVPS